MKVNFSKMTAGDYFNIVYVAMFVIVTVGVIVLIVIDRSRSGAGINSENIARLKKGMTEDEVLDILGCPPGWYAGPKHSPRGTMIMGNFRFLWMNSNTGIALAIHFEGDHPIRVESIHVKKSTPNLNPKDFNDMPARPDLPFRVH